MSETSEPQKSDNQPDDAALKSERNTFALGKVHSEHLFIEDGRKTVEQLYKIYDTLEAAGWTKEWVSEQKITTQLGEVISYPVYAYSWKGSSDQSLWILGGVHGEEPAGPNAFAENISDIHNLKNEGISTVFIPLLNPVSYYRDWRYFNVPRDRVKGSSVTDSDHVLLTDGQPRLQTPANEYAQANIEWILHKQEDFPALVVIDHHEDLLEWEQPEKEDSHYVYSYVNGDKELLAPYCEEISQALSASGSPVKIAGVTDFNEVIENGWVYNSVDGSVDELFSSASYYSNGQIKQKQAALAVFVLETTRTDELDDRLPQRKEAHGNVMKLYPKFYRDLLAVRHKQQVAIAA